MWQDLSVCIKIFDLVTFTLTFDLLSKKNSTLALTFESAEIGAFILQVCIPLARTFCWFQIFLPCDLDLDFWPTSEKT